MSCASGTSYVVKAGDTLFKIAQTFLGDGNRWREINNPDGSAPNPAALQVGQELCLPAFTSGDLFECKETPYTIRVINEAALIRNIIDGLVFCYCKTYPKMAARFNHRAPTGITLRIVQTLNAPAHTVASQALITANASYIKSHLSDVDFITHEGFHIIQSYPPTDQVWITEGLADYARYMYGVKNAEANWGLPARSSPSDVMSGYAHAARFFVWIEKRYRADIRTLDQAMRSQSYTSAIWANMTNMSLDQLLDKYMTDYFI